MPETPRGWLSWAVYVLDAQSRPFSAILDRPPGIDPRLRDSRETALSVLMILEKITKGNGAGKLLAQYYGEEMSWFAFTEQEQEIIRRTSRAFKKELQRVGFMADEDADKQ